MYLKIFLMTATILLSGQVLAEKATTPKSIKSPNTTNKNKATTQAPAATDPVAEAKKEEIVAPVETKATEPTLTKSEEVLKYMKEKFSASYHGELYITRRLPFYEPITNNEQTKFQDLLIMHNPTLIYKPTANWQVLATGEFKYSDKPNYIFYPNTFFRSLFTLTRKNILTEKVNGFQLDAGIGRRQFNTGLAVSSYGNNRIFTTLSKTFNKTKSSLFVQYLHNDYKKQTATTWSHGLEVLPSVTFELTEKLTWLINDDILINRPKDSTTARKYYITHDMNLGYFNYQWNEKLSTYYQLKYLHQRYDFTKDYRTDLESIDYFLGASYSFTPKLTLTGEFGSQLFRASDDKDLFAENIKYPELALYFDMSF